MRNENALRAVLLPEIFRVREYFRVIAAASAEHRERHVLKQEAEAVPLLKAQKHIRTHCKAELRARIQPHELLQSLGGIAFALAQYLDVGHLGALKFRKGKPGQQQPLLRVWAVDAQLLVWRYACRYDEHFVRLQALHDRSGGLDMTAVGRIKAAAVNCNLHFFFSFTRAILGSFALRLYSTNLLPIV